jgi:hypothetical protein
MRGDIGILVYPFAGQMDSSHDYSLTQRTSIKQNSSDKELTNSIVISCTLTGQTSPLLNYPLPLNVPHIPTHLSLVPY